MKAFSKFLPSFLKDKPLIFFLLDTNEVIMGRKSKYFRHAKVDLYLSPNEHLCALKFVPLSIKTDTKYICVPITSTSEYELIWQ